MGNEVHSMNLVLGVLCKALVKEGLLIIGRMSETWLTREMLVIFSQPHYTMDKTLEISDLHPAPLLN